MKNVGKWLALVIIIFLFLIGFMVILFSRPDFLQQFINWSLGIVALITAGTVVYIIINFARRRR